MPLSDPIASLTLALDAALKRDLPAIDWPGGMRRPEVRDVNVYLFSQGWGSTALGFHEIGGSAMTWAYTTVVVMNRTACVYFGGRLAYIVDTRSADFQTDLANHDIVACVDAAERYAYRMSSDSCPISESS